MEKHVHSSSVSGLYRSIRNKFRICQLKILISLQRKRVTTTQCAVHRDHVANEKPESSELDNFFTKLSQCSTKPVILSIVTPYSDSYIPKTIQPTYPKPLQQLYDEKYLDCNYLELLAVCEQVEITVTKEMAIAVETETRAQSNTSL